MGKVGDSQTCESQDLRVVGQTAGDEPYRMRFPGDKEMGVAPSVRNASSQDL